MMNDTFMHPLRPPSRGATNHYVLFALSLSTPAGCGQLGVAAEKKKEMTTLSAYRLRTAAAAVEFGGRGLHSGDRTRDQQSTENSTASRSHLRHWVRTASTTAALLPGVEWVGPAVTCDSLCWCDQRPTDTVRNNSLKALMMMNTPLRFFEL